VSVPGHCGPDGSPVGRLPALGPGLIHRAAGLAAARGRAVLGVVGAPGAGKSTLAAQLAAAIPGSVVVPMDGFHLTSAELRARGWVAERGSPRTFDAEGYVALLQRLRDGDSVIAPGFDRSREEPVPAAIEVPATVRLVITEGNYLLLDVAPWSAVAEVLDEIWFVEVPEPIRLERLVARHIEFGRSPAEASERATKGSDAANARLVAGTRPRADFLLDPQGWSA
jgi:pantothenate kinase